MTYLRYPRQLHDVDRTVTEPTLDVLKCRFHRANTSRIWLSLSSHKWLLLEIMLFPCMAKTTSKPKKADPLPCDAAQDLAIALARRMEESADLKTQPAIARRSKKLKVPIGQTTVGRVVNGAVSTRIGTIDSLAKVFSLKAWQMMIPDMDAGAYRLLSIYNRASPQRRIFLDQAIRDTEKEIDEAALPEEETKPPSPTSRRSRSSS